jgi:hypothetical protein
MLLFFLLFQDGFEPLLSLFLRGRCGRFRRFNGFLWRFLYRFNGWFLCAHTLLRGSLLWYRTLFVGSLFSLLRLGWWLGFLFLEDRG